MNRYSMCWLDYDNSYCKTNGFAAFKDQFVRDFRHITVDPAVINPILLKELSQFITEYFHVTIPTSEQEDEHAIICGIATSSFLTNKYVTQDEIRQLGAESFIIKYIEEKKSIVLVGGSESGLLYSVFTFIAMIQKRIDYKKINIHESPSNPLRLLNHWDNLDGSVERGYAGASLFFKNNQIMIDHERHHDYARLLASIGINGTVINNVNVKEKAPYLITNEYLNELAELASILRAYNIRLFLSVNFMSPVIVGGLDTADPLDAKVQSWWQERVSCIYDMIPDFGGFLVKADSEYNPGPHTYGRSQADGANMLGRAIKPYKGVLIWRAFVYKLQDWRDPSIDRARAAYDIFFPLDGQFEDNVILQIKNGPMDFQVREPVSPLFGKMERTNQILEFQVTQEYTGHQIDLCYLGPQWKEIVGFDTHAKGTHAYVSSIIDGSFYNRPFGGMAAVSNLGDDYNWTGHWLAQANWYAYGRLSWNPNLASADIAEEWVRRTMSDDQDTIHSIVDMLEKSWSIYERYTTPFGLGWMVTPGTHYGPSPEGYEYSIWGTYHRANHKEIGVDRTSSGTGFSAQYHDYWTKQYDNLESCPENLVLFFHRLAYTYPMKNGKTLIQNIYDAHFQAYEEMRAMQRQWSDMRLKIDPKIFAEVEERFTRQEENARQWRDVINSFFYRKSGIGDEQERQLY
uniref:Xylan alpha-1,2-glucuronidase n=1 Tax=Gracilinema caldarium TaxID=215591 RepID=A0A7C3IH80_9SPIR